MHHDGFSVHVLRRHGGTGFLVLPGQGTGQVHPRNSFSCSPVFPPWHRYTPRRPLPVSRSGLVFMEMAACLRQVLHLTLSKGKEIVYFTRQKAAQPRPENIFEKDFHRFRHFFGNGIVNSRRFPKNVFRSVIKLPCPCFFQVQSATCHTRYSGFSASASADIFRISSSQPSVSEAP